ncbi:hypothetical protein AN1V17_03350 [Vallitalea sediminicola]
MDEWSKAIWIFVELIIASLILLSMVLLARTAGDIGRVQQREIDAVAETKEFRTYFRYEENEEIYPQDIISIIFETRGYPEIWVDTTIEEDEEFNYKWTTSLPSNDITWDLTYISENILPYKSQYESSIVKDANGEITRIEFRRIKYGK